MTWENITNITREKCGFQTSIILISLCKTHVHGETEDDWEYILKR